MICGSTIIFSGPLQPSLLGAAVASAKIHPSKENESLQTDLKQKIQYFANLASNQGLPILDHSLTPTFFIGIGDYDAGLDFYGRMIESGFYCNISAFPSVPRNNTGIRCTITRHVTFNYIENIVLALLENFRAVLKKHNLTMSDVYRAFKHVKMIQDPA